MMQVSFEKSPEEFLSKYGAFLARNEVEHNLILTLCQRAARKMKEGESFDIRFSTLSNEDGPVVAAVQTPPHNLILSHASQLDIHALTETLANQNARFPGVVGPSDVASSFADGWTQMTGQKPVEYMDQIIYALTRVVPPAPVEGEFRAAQKGEEKMFAGWIKAFAVDTLPKSEHLDDAAALRRAEEMIRAGAVFFWCVKGRPVSKAVVSGTDKIARIGGVYTPPEFRGHGYASAVVARLSQQQLDQGKKMCCLYADARNPVSNSIYRKIGYEFVSRSSMYVFGRVAV